MEDETGLGEFNTTTATKAYTGRKTNIQIFIKRQKLIITSADKM